MFSNVIYSIIHFAFSENSWMLYLHRTIDWTNLNKIILICAYRSWAIEIFENLTHNEKLKNNFDFILIKDHHTLTKYITYSGNIDMIICIGWSWLVSGEIIEKYFVCGLHPSNLPEFAGGSPIQNQILNGIIESKVTLFKLTNEIDCGPIISKADLSLEGHIDAIFERLAKVGFSILTEFLVQYPYHKLTVVTQPAKIWKRIKPEQSKMNAEDFLNLSVKELYDFIRCRENPYPNAFIEDETGRLEFKETEFYPKIVKP